MSKTGDQKARLYYRFRGAKILDNRYVTSTDGRIKVVAPKTRGKKKNQLKRKVNVKTVTWKKNHRNAQDSDSDMLK